MTRPEKARKRVENKTRSFPERTGFTLGSASISTKAILLSITLTVIFITVVFVNLSIVIRKETKQFLQDMLNRSERQVMSIKEDNLAQLLWVSTQVTNNPTLRAAMETYRLESNLSGETRAELLATLQNELDKIWMGLPHDILFVTDEKGEMLAANGPVSSLPEIGENLSLKTALKHALNPLAPIGDQNFGVTNLGGEHYLIGTSPIDLQGYVIGTLTLGDRIDSSFLPNLRAFFGGSIVVTVGGQVIASTLPQTSGDNSVARMLDRLGSETRQADGTVRLGDENYLITSMLLGLDDTGVPVTLHLLRSLTEALRQPNQTLMKMLVTQALLAVLLGALLAWLATRVSLRPLERFVAFMKEVAETGDYSRRFRRRKPSVKREQLQSTVENLNPVAADSTSNDEFDLLINALNQMLAVIETRDIALKNAHTKLEEGIRKLNKKDEQLRHMQKMEAIGLLAGGVAHDFNNILMVISGFSELALLSLEDDHDARANIEEVQKASKSASLLTRQLLAFSSKHVIKPEIINLNTMISGLEKILHRIIGESIDLSTRLDKNIGNVIADPAQMEQIVLNLIVNSRDAIKANGKICIETAYIDPQQNLEAKRELGLQAPHTMMAVSDNGCGIDDETMARMFEPFFTTKEHGKGTGLGLSTVHGIVKQSGGLIRVKSQPGQGTVFRVYLPCVARAVEEASQANKGSHITRAETILVVEDDPGVRRIVCKLLSLRGFKILESSDPVTALKLFEQHIDNVDLLITDVIMPVMNGRQLYEQIVLIRPDIKVLYISGYADGVIDNGGILADGVNFLQKPFSPDALTAKVEQVLDQC